MFGRAISDLFGLFAVRRCPVCGDVLMYGHRFVCVKCLMDAPITDMSSDRNNMMNQVVRTQLPAIEMSSSLIFYIHKGLWRSSIHRLKYYGYWQYCRHYGEWLGVALRESPHYADVDCVVAVPLHPRRLLKRGYNQSEYIASGVAKSMGIDHLRGAVQRIRHNKPQARMGLEDRWCNVEGLFGVDSKSRELLKGRNILVVDDVFTTGATMIACAERILRSVEGCRVWIAVVAIAGREFRIG